MRPDHLSRKAAYGFILLLLLTLGMSGDILGSAPARVSAMGGEAPRYPPLPAASDPKDVLDFPGQPPRQLAESVGSESELPPRLNGSNPPSPLAQSGPRGMRLRKTVLAKTGRSVTVADSSNGEYLFATQGIFFTAHENTNFYDARSGARIATIWKRLKSLHAMYEVETYRPLSCPTWTLADAVNVSDDTGAATYPFLRFTKINFSWRKRWIVEQYMCDGSMREVFRIEERHWPEAYTRLDVFKSGSEAELPVATIDQPYLFELSAHLDTWSAPGLDDNLVALLATVMHMHANFVMRSSAKGSGGGKGGGSGKR
mmetsp:Transcript_32140/g.75484  ORF Transcript_32140/g.75484 Transcript_32140/m.75484 type:complete len:314 (+) Transcript_32140:82-1023(+)|eukprot:CAMPEP_0178423368 /NCGR_PEP_ID=MMETSP0689_2-20121128/27651_1 /TAXON_ID=160604 /ORGANISM="Amphidinium massartii, Strain CS-259" /LENGTH=313 /DNA_ID=CAMNT_0020044957 /DNA_START=29 /DNA_END=970 /DNA_ORIENTATION=-